MRLFSELQRFLLAPALDSRAARDPLVQHGGSSLRSCQFSAPEFCKLNDFFAFAEIHKLTWNGMLGSVADAEDMLQETFIRGKQKLDLIPSTSALCGPRRPTGLDSIQSAPQSFC
jgi:hypothetical protein